MIPIFAGYTRSRGALSPVLLSPADAGAWAWYDATQPDALTGAQWLDTSGNDRHIPLLNDNSGVTHDSVNGFMIGDGTDAFSTTSFKITQIPLTMIIVGEIQSGYVVNDIGVVSFADVATTQNYFASQLLKSGSDFYSRCVARSSGTFDPVDSKNTLTEGSSFTIVNQWNRNNRRITSLNGAGFNSEYTSYTPVGIDNFSIGALKRTTTSYSPFKYKHVVVFDRVVQQWEIDAIVNYLENRTPLLNYNVNWFGSDGLTTPWYAITYPSSINDMDENKLYIAYEGWDGVQRNQMITQYDYSTGKWDVGSYIGVTREALADNDHGNPSILKLASGYFVMFGNAHSEFSDLQISTSANVNDIRNWVEQSEYADFGLTYPNPHEYNGDIVVFARAAIAGGSYPLYKLPISVSGNTTTNGTAVPLVDWGTNRCYISKSLKVGTEVYIVVTFADSTDTYRKDLYLFIYDLATDTIRDLQDTVSYNSASWPIDKTDSDTYFRIVDQGSNYGGESVRFCFDSDDNLHFLYTEGSSPSSTNYYVKHLYWNGSTLSTPVQIGGICKQRYDGCEILANPSGGVNAYWVSDDDYAYGRSGDMSKASWTQSGGWVDLSEIQQSNVLYGLGRPKEILNSSSLSSISWTEEIVNPATGGADSFAARGGNLRMYVQNPNTTYITKTLSTLTQTDALVARMATQPSDARIQSYDQVFRSLAQINMLAELDCLYLLAAHEEETALLNLIKDQYNLTNNGATFTADEGFTGNGSSAYLSTGFTSANFSITNSTGQDVASVFSLTAAQDDNPMLGVINVTNSTKFEITPRNTSDLFTGEMDSTGALLSTANTDGLGWYSVRRSRSSGMNYLYKSYESLTSASRTKLTCDGTVTLLRNGSSYSSSKVGAAALGYMSNPDTIGNLEMIVRRYLADVGAIT